MNVQNINLNRLLPNNWQVYQFDMNQSVLFIFSLLQKFILTDNIIFSHHMMLKRDVQVTRETLFDDLQL